MRSKFRFFILCLLAFALYKQEGKAQQNTTSKVQKLTEWLYRGRQESTEAYLKRLEEYQAKWLNFRGRSCT